MKTNLLSLGLLFVWMLFAGVLSAQGRNRPVVLFTEANFCGESFSLNADWTTARHDDRWNDAIASIVVPRGYEVWIFEHSDFRGETQVLHRDWSVADDPWWQYRISSIRVVRSYDRPNRRRGGDRYRQGGRRGGAVTIYEHEHFSGASQTLRRDWSVRYTDDFWNDRISSIDVPPGWVVIIYEHANFRGRSARIDGPWTIRRHNHFWNDRISSIEILRR